MSRQVAAFQARAWSHIPPRPNPHRTTPTAVAQIPGHGICLASGSHVFKSTIEGWAGKGKPSLEISVEAEQVTLHCASTSDAAWLQPRCAVAGPCWAAAATASRGGLACGREQGWSTRLAADSALPWLPPRHSGGACHAAPLPEQAPAARALIHYLYKASMPAGTSQQLLVHTLTLAGGWGCCWTLASHTAPWCTPPACPQALPPAALRRTRLGCATRTARSRRRACTAERYGAADCAAACLDTLLLTPLAAFGWDTLALVMAQPHAVREGPLVSPACRLRLPRPTLNMRAAAGPSGLHAPGVLTRCCRPTPADGPAAAQVRGQAACGAGVRSGGCQQLSGS